MVYLAKHIRVKTSATSIAKCAFTKAHKSSVSQNSPVTHASTTYQHNFTSHQHQLPKHASVAAASPWIMVIGKTAVLPKTAERSKESVTSITIFYLYNYIIACKWQIVS